MNLHSTLNQALEKIELGHGASAVDNLCDTLRFALDHSSADEWQRHIIPLCRSHPVHQVLLQDPYTARAYFKPRGYAGDAEMLDYVYSGIPPLNTTYAGRAIFQGTTTGSNGRSVVYRRDFLSSRVDDIARSVFEPKILSLACGHLREASKSQAVLGGAVKSYVGVDQDSKSLEVAENNAVADSIKFVNGSVLDIIRGRLSFQDFDFVYAAGLFDYLSSDLAKRLLCKCLEFLNPGGRLLIGNFAPDNHGRGYMECFMDWKLICRAEADLNELGVAIPETKVADSKIYRDPEGNVVYLDIQRT